MPRLFVAIRLPEEVQDALLDVMEALDGARWQDADYLHLTLRFIGDVDRHTGNDLVEQLRRIHVPRFMLDISGVGHFEHKGKVHSLWAKVPPTEELEALRQQVESACSSAGLERETRRFIPHVTIARLSSGSGPIDGWLSANGTLRTDPWEVDHFSLFESRLSQKGAYYTEITRFEL